MEVDGEIEKGRSNIPGKANHNKEEFEGWGGSETRLVVLQLEVGWVSSFLREQGSGFHFER